MIKINFSPVRADEKTSASLDGHVLTVNGKPFDLSLIPEGATVRHPVIQNATRTGADVELTLTLAHGPNAPEATRFPEPVEITGGAWELDYVYEPEQEAAGDELDQ